MLSCRKLGAIWSHQHSRDLASRAVLSRLKCDVIQLVVFTYIFSGLMMLWVLSLLRLCTLLAQIVACVFLNSGQFIAARMFYLCNFCRVFDTPSWFAQMNPAPWSPSERKQKWGREPMLELRCLNVYISGCQICFLGLQSDVHARRRWPSGVSHGYKAYNKSNLETTWLWLARSLQSIVFQSFLLSCWRQSCFTLVSDCKQKEFFCGSELSEIAHGFCLSIASQHPVKQFSNSPAYVK